MRNDTMLCICSQLLLLLILYEWGEYCLRETIIINKLIAFTFQSYQPWEPLCKKITALSDIFESQTSPTLWDVIIKITLNSPLVALVLVHTVERYKFQSTLATEKSIIDIASLDNWFRHQILAFFNLSIANVQLLYLYGLPNLFKHFCLSLLWLVPKVESWPRKRGSFQTSAYISNCPILIVNRWNLFIPIS